MAEIIKKDIKEIWMVSREYGDIAGAGGVKDVVSGLSEALARSAVCEVHVVLPCYGFIDPDALGFLPLVDPLNRGLMLRFDTDINYPDQDRKEKVTVHHTLKDGVNIYLLGAERFREKSNVYTYTAADELLHPWQKKGEGHFDYFAMNILLQKASLDLMILLGAHPDVIHCHDGHAAVLPAMLHELPGYRHYFRDTGCVVTVHNAGLGYHQEVADLEFARAATGLPLATVMASLLDDKFDPFLVSSTYAILNTVSENYARELRETADDKLTGWLGHSLKKRDVLLEGVTNGIDHDAMAAAAPEKTGLPAAFDIAGDQELTGKIICKESLLQLLASDAEIPGIRKSGTLAGDPALPLVTFIGRLSGQKGVDVLTGAIADLLDLRKDFQFLLLGSGGLEEEEELISLAQMKANRGRVCILRGYDTSLATKIYAAGDFFVVPSRYEPCGLTDFMAQLFGNLPIVHSVGGLVKVVNGQTGFSYEKQSVFELKSAIGRALELYFNDPAAIRKMQKQAVKLIEEKYTWDMVSKKYLDLYERSQPDHFMEALNDNQNWN